MKKVNIITLVLLIFFAASMCFHGMAASTSVAETDAYDTSTDASFVGQSDYTSESFSSNLPLIILEETGINDENGTEENVAASMRVVDSGGGNRPDGEPRYNVNITLSAIRYENNEPRPKKDYLVLLADDGGNGKITPMEGLSSGDRWFLLGGAYDKSLIRNYLGYTLTKNVAPNAPGVRFCELLLKTSGGYEYQGVYLLVEGTNTGDTVTARRTMHYWEGHNQTVVANSFTGLFVLQEGWSGGTGTAAMQSAINNVGGMFQSTDTNYYLQYGDVLDRDSFYAYFLVNELMANYEEMSESVYSYDPVTRKISIGPVWNFERALDNRKDEALDLRRIYYQSAPFYQHMIIDSEFVNGLISFSKDYAGILNSAEFTRLIDNAVAELGAAQARDWRRWRSFYFSEQNALSPNVPAAADTRIGLNGVGYDGNGALLIETLDYYVKPVNAPERIRQFETYEQEIIKLRFYANERPVFVRKAILLLKNQDELLTEVNAYGKNNIWAALFLIGFIVSIILARRTAER